MGEPINDYRDLKVWFEAMSLAEAVYLETKAFPKAELFGMTSQMRRSAASVPANIAEGFGREKTQSFIHFLRVAQGSLKELETHILLAQRVDLLLPEARDRLLSQTTTIGKMLRSFIRSLANRSGGPK